MGAAAAGVVVAGTAMKIYGDSQRAKAESRAAQASAESKRIQAYDILKRVKYNMAATREEGESFKAGQIGRYIAGGVELQGSALLALEDTAHKLSMDLINQRYEADAKANALFRGADIDTQLSGDIEKAQKWNTYGTILSTASAFQSGSK